MARLIEHFADSTAQIGCEAHPASAAACSRGSVLFSVCVAVNGAFTSRSYLPAVGDVSASQQESKRVRCRCLPSREDVHLFSRHRAGAREDS